MIAALGTLPFLATLWLLVVLGARTLEESGAKVAAALKGEPMREPAPTAARLRIRMRPQVQSRNAYARLRAAA